MRPNARKQGASYSEFQFTHPGRGATSILDILDTWPLSFNSRTPGGVRRCTIVSIVIIRCFNSRTPGGVRPSACVPKSSTRRFQFTHPGRGATNEAYNECKAQAVSIHAPREGCDEVCPISSAGCTSFNSRTPGGVRLASSDLARVLSNVSIHAPREGCDST